MGELTVSQARENLAELIDSTQRSGEPVVLTRHGRPVAVVLDHALFERLVAAADDTSDRQVRRPVTHRYDVRLARRAVRSLALLQRQEQLRIRAAIDLLAENPRPPGCVALQGEPGVFRVRVGDFRILYEVLDGLLLVQVVRIGHRREVYR
jgi:mRNA interferase RelE/StbE